ncbi:MAG: methylmalonyl Co-A mutase-associated GTPase MeaB [Pseudomonadota bacterium]
MSEAVSRLSPQAIAARLVDGDRAALGRAITLAESRHPDRRAEADAILSAVLPKTGGAVRVGITGVPGVGKSTLIDQLGMNLIAAGHRIAVLAVDPSSGRSGGSILGDKTRMAALSMSDAAFIRPSPTAGTLGGVARRTRETMLLTEAAGFDVIIVETVGVGQSETAVAGMVDVFVVMVLPGGGDELQGIKKGVIELADVLAINKADGDQAAAARRTAGDYQGAVNLLSGHDGARAPVLTLSGLENRGLDELWDAITTQVDAGRVSGAFDTRRADQAVDWMEDLLQVTLYERLLGTQPARTARKIARDRVRAGAQTPAEAVADILAAAGPSGS